MRKVFSKTLAAFMALALVISLVAIFILQTITTKASNEKLCRDKLQTVKEKLDSNQEEIDRL